MVKRPSLPWTMTYPFSLPEVPLLSESFLAKLCGVVVAPLFFPCISVSTLAARGSNRFPLPFYLRSLEHDYVFPWPIIASPRVFGTP